MEESFAPKAKEEEVPSPGDEGYDRYIQKKAQMDANWQKYYIQEMPPTEKVHINNPISFSALLKLLQTFKGNTFVRKLGVTKTSFLVRVRSSLASVGPELVHNILMAIRTIERCASYASWAEEINAAMPDFVVWAFSTHWLAETLADDTIRLVSTCKSITQNNVYRKLTEYKWDATLSINPRNIEPVAAPEKWKESAIKNELHLQNKNMATIECGRPYKPLKHSEFLGFNALVFLLKTYELPVLFCLLLKSQNK